MYQAALNKTHLPLPILSLLFQNDSLDERMGKNNTHLIKHTWQYLFRYFKMTV